MENITLLEELSKLREENKRLKQLLKAHNINYEVVEKSTLSVEEKITIYKSFFKGRTDVFTEKFIRKDGSKGYSIVCSNKKTPVCLIRNGISKPCQNCKNNIYAHLTDIALANHMKGEVAYGIYPVIDNVYFQKLLFVSKTEQKSLIKEFVDITEQYINAVGPRITRVTLNNNWKIRINIIKNYI